MNSPITSTEFVELILSCGSWQEAQKIADSLLQKKLVVCVEFIEVKSKYRWKSAMEGASEVKLIMQTVSNLFDEVESEVAKLHSYETFVLHQIPITRTSSDAAKWLKSEVKQ